jgi:hypothetical protein
VDWKGLHDCVHAHNLPPVIMMGCQPMGTTHQLATRSYDCFSLN